MNNLERRILDLFKQLSICIMVMGRRGSGKTDMALLIMEILNKFGVMVTFATNIKIHSSTFHIEYITNLEDLQFWCQNNKGRKLFIFDEAGKSIRRRTPMSKLNVEMLDQLQILRKYKLSLILIAPRDKYIDSATLGSDVLDAIIIKPDFKNPKVALFRNIFEDLEIWFTDIPSTKIDFDTWDIATFKKGSPMRKPNFKTEEMKQLWEWSHGMTYKDLKVHPMKLNRILRKFVKEVLEREVHTSQTRDREDNSPDLM